jgi:hypothetical protein
MDRKNPREAPDRLLTDERKPIEHESQLEAMREHPEVDPDRRKGSGDDDLMPDNRDRRDPARPVQLDAEGMPAAPARPDQQAPARPGRDRQRSGKPESGKPGTPTPTR